MRTGVLALIAVLANFVCLILWAPSFMRTPECNTKVDFDRLTIGMTEVEAVRTIGRPADSYHNRFPFSGIADPAKPLPDRKCLIWYGAHGSAVVNLYEGRIYRMYWNDQPTNIETRWQKLARWVRSRLN